MKPKLQWTLRRLAARGHGRWAVDRVAEVARFFLAGYENMDWDPRHNGELMAMEIILKHAGRAPVLVDVGANVGDWTSAALQIRPDATVHCLEVVPELAQQIQQRFEDNSRVMVHAHGLGRTSQTVAVSYSPLDSTKSRIVDRAGAEISGGTLESTIQQGDEWVSTSGLTAIDLLKVDTEGHDLAVLEGFQQTLKDGRVGCIQFEYGRVSLGSGARLMDFYDLLTPLGFVIGKIYPRFVEFRTYSGTRHEDFPGLNYLAVPMSASPLRAQLSNPRVGFS